MNKRGQGEGTISKLKNGSYCGRLTIGYDENGKQKRKAFYGKTKRYVQEKMDCAKVELAKDEFIEDTRLTVGKWIDEWLLKYKKRALRLSTYGNYFSISERHIKPALGNIKLKDLRAEMVQKFVNDLSDKQLSRASIHLFITCLKGALSQAVDNKLITHNVAENVILPSEKAKKARILTADEQERFIAVAEKYSYGQIYILMLSAGLRIGEATALTWEDIDFENGLLSINKTHTIYVSPDDGKTHRGINPPKTKSGHRIVPLLPNVLDMLGRRKNNCIDETKLIFTDESGRLPCITTFIVRCKKIAKLADITEDIHLHSLRHTFATRGLENGIELKVMQELMGHASINMTADIYTHVSSDKKQEAIMKLANTIPL